MVIFMPNDSTNPVVHADAFLRSRGITFPPELHFLRGLEPGESINFPFKAQARAAVVTWMRVFGLTRWFSLTRREEVTALGPQPAPSHLRYRLSRSKDFLHRWSPDFAVSCDDSFIKHVSAVLMLDKDAMEISELQPRDFMGHGISTQTLGAMANNLAKERLSCERRFDADEYRQRVEALCARRARRAAANVTPASDSNPETSGDDYCPMYYNDGMDEVVEQSVPEAATSSGMGLDTSDNEALEPAYASEDEADVRDAYPDTVTTRILPSRPKKVSTSVDRTEERAQKKREKTDRPAKGGRGAERRRLARQAMVCNICGLVGHLGDACRSRCRTCARMGLDDGHDYIHCEVRARLAEQRAQRAAAAPAAAGGAVGPPPVPAGYPGGGGGGGAAPPAPGGAAPPVPPYQRGNEEGGGELEEDQGFRDAFVGANYGTMGNPTVWIVTRTAWRDVRLHTLFKIMAFVLCSILFDAVLTLGSHASLSAWGRFVVFIVELLPYLPAVVYLCAYWSPWLFGLWYLFSVRVLVLQSFGRSIDHIDPDGVRHGLWNDERFEALKLGHARYDPEYCIGGMVLLPYPLYLVCLFRRFMWNVSRVVWIPGSAGDMETPFGFNYFYRMHVCYYSLELLRQGYCPRYTSGTEKDNRLLYEQHLGRDISVNLSKFTACNAGEAGNAFIVEVVQARLENGMRGRARRFRAGLNLQ